MTTFNLSSRVLMFSICTSLEYDLKNFILKSSNIKFTNTMRAKAEKRSKLTSFHTEEEILNELDLSDFVQIISENPYDFDINNEKVRLLNDYFKKIIPVRNRVMHTRPLELGDRSILTEVLDEIDQRISWFTWNETIKTKEIIQNNPSKLMESGIEISKDYGCNILHNIPVPEFDDTGYIGRKKEITEISSLILNKKNQIITLIGNGGIGKTSITVKILYDLIDNPANDFEAIIWISLKTRTLSKGEFNLIEDSIKSLAEIFSYGEKIIVSEANLTPEENILRFMREFKVLLVLDNLETISSDEIIYFLKNIPEKSKVLITSRHGIGELEYRYLLEGLNPIDAITYYRELSKYYGLHLHKLNDKEIKKLVTESLYSNPLSIKWFISGIYSGLDITALIYNKDKLIEFCMSNVFEKLTELSKNILQLFLIHSLELSYGTIDYYIGADDIETRKSINELLSTNMVKIVSGKYALNDMAKDYLSLFHKPSNDFMKEVIQKKRELNTILQNIKVKNENDPFNPVSLVSNLKDDNSNLASYYLTKALEYSKVHDWHRATSLIDKAASIAPNYFEVYKIKAFILAENNDYFGAILNYDIALNKAEDEFEKATILYLYGVFYIIKLPEFEKALEFINLADSYTPDESSIIFEKSRVLMYLGKYDEAETILKTFKERNQIKSKKVENLYASRYADLLRRKAEKYEKRDFELKMNCLKEAIEKIEDVSDIDTKTYIILTAILRDVSYLYYDDTAMQLLYDVLYKHFEKLHSIYHSNIKKIMENISNHQHFIPQHLYDSIIKLMRDFKEEGKLIEDEMVGIVTTLKDNFGFIVNSHYPKGIYFSRNSGNKEIQLGDKVSFETFVNFKGDAAKNIELFL